jgi:hypothetical protein
MVVSSSKCLPLLVSSVGRLPSSSDQLGMGGPSDYECFNVLEAGSAQSWLNELLPYCRTKIVNNHVAYEGALESEQRRGGLSRVVRSLSKVLRDLALFVHVIPL